MDSCGRCVQLSKEVESVNVQKKKMMQLLNLLNASKKHKEQLLEHTLEFIKSKDEYYKKEQAKIKEIANKVKKTTKESVLKNVPKQIDELSALYINKIAELQKYSEATEVARVAKSELETKILELEGNKMYVKQLIADSEAVRAENKVLQESMLAMKKERIGTQLNERKVAKEYSRLKDARAYKYKVEFSVRKALSRLQTNDSQSKRSCMKILSNLMEYFQTDPLFESRKSVKGEKRPSVESPSSVSSGYNSATASPWSNPYNSQEEEVIRQFNGTFNAEGKFILTPVTPLSDSQVSSTSTSSMLCNTATSSMLNNTPTSSTLKNTPTSSSILKNISTSPTLKNNPTSPTINDRSSTSSMSNKSPVISIANNTPSTSSIFNPQVSPSTLTASHTNTLKMDTGLKEAASKDLNGNSWSLCNSSDEEIDRHHQIQDITINESGNASQNESLFDESAKTQASNKKCVKLKKKGVRSDGDIQSAMNKRKSLDQSTKDPTDEKPDSSSFVCDIPNNKGNDNNLVDADVGKLKLIGDKEEPSNEAVMEEHCDKKKKYSNGKSKIDDDSENEFDFEMSLLSDISDDESNGNIDERVGKLLENLLDQDDLDVGGSSALPTLIDADDAGDDKCNNSLNKKSKDNIFVVKPNVESKLQVGQNKKADKGILSVGESRTEVVSSSDNDEPKGFLEREWNEDVRPTRSKREKFRLGMLKERLPNELNVQIENENHVEEERSVQGTRKISTRKKENQKEERNDQHENVKDFSEEKTRKLKNHKDERNSNCKEDDNSHDNLKGPSYKSKLRNSVSKKKESETESDSEKNKSYIKTRRHSNNVRIEPSIKSRRFSDNLSNASAQVIKNRGSCDDVCTKSSAKSRRQSDHLSTIKDISVSKDRLIEVPQESTHGKYLPNEFARDKHLTKCDDHEVPITKELAGDTAINEVSDVESPLSKESVLTKCDDNEVPITKEFARYTAINEVDDGESPLSKESVGEVTKTSWLPVSSCSLSDSSDDEIDDNKDEEDTVHGKYNSVVPNNPHLPNLLATDIANKTRVDVPATIVDKLKTEEEHANVKSARESKLIKNCGIHKEDDVADKKIKLKAIKAKDKRQSSETATESRNMKRAFTENRKINVHDSQVKVSGKQKSLFDTSDDESDVGESAGEQLEIVLVQHTDVVNDTEVSVPVENCKMVSDISCREENSIVDTKESEERNLNNRETILSESIASSEKVLASDNERNLKESLTEDCRVITAKNKKLRVGMLKERHPENNLNHSNGKETAKQNEVTHAGECDDGNDLLSKSSGDKKNKKWPSRTSERKSLHAKTGEEVTTKISEEHKDFPIVNTNDPILKCNSGRKFKTGSLKKVASANSLNANDDIVPLNKKPKLKSDEIDDVNYKKNSTKTSDIKKKDTEHEETMNVEESSSDLLSVQKFNKKSGSIMAKPVQFVTNARKSVEAMDEKTKGDFNDNKTKVKKVNSGKSVKSMETSVLPMNSTASPRKDVLKDGIPKADDNVLANNEQNREEIPPVNENNQALVKDYTISSQLCKSNNNSNDNYVAEMSDAVFTKPAIPKRPKSINKRVNKILKEMNFSENFPFINDMPATPPLRKHEDTGFKKFNSYQASSELDLAELKELFNSSQGESNISFTDISFEGTEGKTVDIPNTQESIVDNIDNASVLENEVTEKTNCSQKEKIESELNQIAYEKVQSDDEEEVSKEPNNEDCNMITKATNDKHICVKNQLMSSSSTDNMNLKSTQETNLADKNTELPNLSSPKISTRRSARSGTFIFSPSIETSQSPLSSDNFVSPFNQSLTISSSSISLVKPLKCPSKLKTPPSVFPKVIQDRLSALSADRNLPITNNRVPSHMSANRNLPVANISNLTHNKRITRSNFATNDQNISRGQVANSSGQVANSLGQVPNSLVQVPNSPGQVPNSLVQVPNGPGQVANRQAQVANSSVQVRNLLMDNNTEESSSDKKAEDITVKVTNGKYSHNPMKQIHKDNSNSSPLKQTMAAIPTFYEKNNVAPIINGTLTPVINGNIGPIGNGNIVPNIVNDGPAKGNLPVLLNNFKTNVYNSTQENILGSNTKPVVNIALPTFSLYNSTGASNKRKCEEQLEVSGEESKKLKPNETVADANTAEAITEKDYRLIEDALEHLHEEVGKEDTKGVPCQFKTSKIIKTLNIILNNKNKEAFVKSLMENIKELAAFPLEMLARRMVSLFDKLTEIKEGGKDFNCLGYKLMVIILQVHKKTPEFVPIFQKTIHETIALHSENILLTNLYSLVKLYINLCRWRNDSSSIMTLLYDVCYFHKKRILNVMDVVLLNWPTVYPIGSPCMLVRIMTAIVLNLSPPQKIFYDEKNTFVRTKQSLRTTYMYRDQFTLVSLLGELMNLIQNERQCCHAGSKCVEKSMVLLSKHWSPSSDVYNVVVERHLAALFRSSLDGGYLRVAATCAELMGMIAKAFPRASSLASTLSLLSILSWGLHHPSISTSPPTRVSIGRAICYLFSHNADSARNILTSVEWSESEVDDLKEAVTCLVIAPGGPLDYWRELLKRNRCIGGTSEETVAPSGRSHRSIPAESPRKFTFST